MNRPIYKLKDWVDINKLSWAKLPRNPKIISHKNFKNYLCYGLEDKRLIEKLFNGDLFIEFDFNDLITNTNLEIEDSFYEYFSKNLEKFNPKKCINKLLSWKNYIYYHIYEEWANEKIYKEKMQRLIGFIEKNIEKLTIINWEQFSKLEKIFTLDYEKMKDNFQPLAKEIIEKSLHPKKLERHLKMGGKIEDF